MSSAISSSFNTSFEKILLSKQSSPIILSWTPPNSISDQAEGMEALVMEALALVESSTLDEGRKVAARKKINKTSFKSLPRLIEYLNTLQP